MALEGSIKEFGLADIFQLLYYQKKTGVLQIDCPFDSVKIYFHEGNILSVKSKRRPEEHRLGRLLIKKRLIDEAKLNKILNEQKETKQRLGDLLIKHGFVSKEELKEIVTKHIVDQIVHLFTWKTGWYVFKPQSVSIDKELGISLDTQHILMEGLRIIDEWSVIEGILTVETVFKKTAKAAEAEDELSDEEREILNLVDGESDVSTIVDVSGLDDFVASKILVSLLDRGFIEPVEETRVVQKESPRKRLLSPTVLNYLVPLVILFAFFSSLFSFHGEAFNVRKSLQAISHLEYLRELIEQYRLTHGVYPEELPQKNLRDPWGKNYFYIVEGNYYRLFSAGADGVPQTDDDIW